MITIENKTITVTVVPNVVNVETDPNEITVEVTKGKDGKGVPAGGTAGQVLKKVSGTDYDTEWSSAGTASWGSITGTLSQQEDLYDELDSRPTAADLGALAMQDEVNLSTDVNNVLPVANGGTGAAAAAGARENLGLGDLAVKDTADLSADVTGTLPLGSGGTGATTAADARTALGLGALSTAADAPSDGTEYVRKNGAWAANSGSGGGVWGSITGTLSDQTDLNTALSAKLESVDLSTDVTGTLPVANGGTGATTAAGALTNLGAMEAEPDHIDLSTPSGSGMVYVDFNHNGKGTNWTSRIIESAAGTLNIYAENGLTYEGYPVLTGNSAGLLPLTKGGTGAATAADARTALGAIPDAPSDGTEYVRKDGAWTANSGSGGGVWGSITGTLSDQTDLNTALSAKLESVDLSSDVTGTLPLANGGTGAATAAGARDNLGLGGIALKDSVNMSTDVTGTLPVANGGTGATTAAGARDNLGLGDLAVKDTADLTTDVTGALPVANGGTGAATAAGALTNLGAMAAEPVQITLKGDGSALPALVLMQQDGSSLNCSYLGELSAGQLHIVANNGLYHGTDTSSPILTGNSSGLLPLTKGGTGASTAAGARTALGAIPDAPSDGAEYVRKDGAWAVNSGGGSGSAAWGGIVGTLSNQTDLQTALDAKLESVSLTSDVTGVLPVSSGGTGATDALLARWNLGLASLATLDAVPLATHVSGILPIQNGGTEATTALGAREKLGIKDLALKDTADLTSDVTGTLPLANGGTGATTAADARTNLGLGTLATQSDISTDGLFGRRQTTVDGTSTQSWEALGSMATMNDASSDNVEYVRKNGAWTPNTGGGSGGTAAWGAIAGTLSNQTDLQTALDAKLESVDLTSDVTGALGVANGGTGGTTAADARENLGLGDLAVKDTADLSTDVTGALGVANGGTGGTTAADARENLGLGDLAVKDTADLSTDVTGALGVANGGTGGTTAADARTGLGLGTLATQSDISTDGLFGRRQTTVDGVSTQSWEALGSMATMNDASSDDVEYVRKNGAWTPNTGGGGGGGSVAWGSVTGTLSNQTDLQTALDAKLESVDLTADVSGALPIANGGTGSTTAANARTALGLGSMATVNSPVPIANGGTGLTASPSMLTNLGSTTAANVLQASPRPGITGTLAIGHGGTGLTASPSMLTNLGSTTAANVLQASPRPGITGTLPIAFGGTGATTAANARSALGITAIATRANYSISTTDLTAGTSALTTGKLYFVYS